MEKSTSKTQLMNNPRCQSSFYYSILLIFGVVFFFMNMFSPMSGDDYAYCFYYDDHSVLLRPTPERVTNFAMAVESMWNHYHIVNGRFISHLVFQCVDALLGKEVFNVLNSLFFVALLHLLVLLSKHKNSVVVLAMSFLSLMCILPHPGQTMLWMAGSVNYLWTATFALAYIYWLSKHEGETKSWAHYIILFIIGVIIGWTNESISAPLAFGLFIYYLVNRSSFKGVSIPSFFGYALGAGLVILAPGTFSRLSAEQDVVMSPMSIDQFLFTHIYALLQGYVFCVIPFIVLCIYIIRLIKRFRLKNFLFCLKNRYTCIFIGFTFALFVLGMFDTMRIFYGVSLFAFIIFLSYLDRIISRLEHNPLVVVFLLFVCVVPSGFALSATYDYSKAHAKNLSLVESKPKQCVISQSSSLKDSRFCYYGGMETLSPDRYNYHNRVKAFYYGKEYIQSLPKAVYEAWENDSLDLLKDYHVIPVTKYQMVPHRISAIYHYDPSEELLAIHQRVIRYLLNSTEMLAQKKDVYYVSRNDKNWLLVPKDTRAVTIEVPMMENGKESIQPIQVY